MFGFSYKGTFVRWGTSLTLTRIVDGVYKSIRLPRSLILFPLRQMVLSTKLIKWSVALLLIPSLRIIRIISFPLTVLIVWWVLSQVWGMKTIVLNGWIVSVGSVFVTWGFVLPLLLFVELTHLLLLGLAIKRLQNSLETPEKNDTMIQGFVNFTWESLSLETL